ncbi:MAG: alpha/beta hydrolase fold protein [Betaproteobacteria bacterium]|nr:alpha/beta hydrolase fold protein [Betaproteobacteria bacterium]
MTQNVERALVKTSMGFIHYRAAGNGKPVVLLHMNQQSSALYLELIAALAPKVRAIAIDYPSHGMSDHVSLQPTINDYARWVIEVMDALQLKTSSFIGESGGAVIAIDLAVNLAQRVDKIVMVNCPWYPDAQTATRNHGALKTGARPSDSSGFPTTRTIDFVLANDPAHSPMQPTQSWMDRINRAQLEAGRERWQVLDALHQYDMPANLPRVQRPALQLTGEHFIYRKDHAEFAARMKDLKQAVIPGGRCCVGWEKADEIARHSIEFIGA